MDAVARELGADAVDQVPFEKYAAAAEKLVNPSSAARAVEAGATAIERVDLLVQRIAAAVGMRSDEVDAVVTQVSDRLTRNAAVAATSTA